MLTLKCPCYPDRSELPAIQYYNICSLHQCILTCNWGCGSWLIGVPFNRAYTCKTSHLLYCCWTLDGLLSWPLTLQSSNALMWFSLNRMSLPYNWPLHGIIDISDLSPTWPSILLTCSFKSFNLNFLLHCVSHWLLSPPSILRLLQPLYFHSILIMECILLLDSS